MNETTHRFWIEFTVGPGDDLPPGVCEGVGVTAEDATAALAIVRRELFGEGPMPPVRRVLDDVQTTDLCPWLVLPNMLDWTPIGIWFPVAPR